MERMRFSKLPFLAVILSAAAWVPAAQAIPYTFVFDSVAENYGVTISVTSLEDVNVQIQLSALNAAFVGTSPNGAGTSTTNPGALDITGTERLVITPLGGFTGPFTLVSVQFGNINTGGGQSGDQVVIYHDGVSQGSFTPTPAGSPSFLAASVPGGASPWNNTIAFGADDGNDAFRVRQIVIDGTFNRGDPVIPEPTTWTLFGLGLGAAVWLRRRRA
jgi:hypothetical protein